MKLLKATLYKKGKIEKLNNGGDSIHFTKDVNGDWVVGASVLTIGNYKPEVMAELKKLEIINSTLPDPYKDIT